MLRSPSAFRAIGLRYAHPGSIAEGDWCLAQIGDHDREGYVSLYLPVMPMGQEQLPVRQELLVPGNHALSRRTGSHQDRRL